MNISVHNAWMSYKLTFNIQVPSILRYICNHIMRNWNCIRMVQQNVFFHKWIIFICLWKIWKELIWDTEKLEGIQITWCTYYYTTWYILIFPGIWEQLSVYPLSCHIAYTSKTFLRFSIFTFPVCKTGIK